MGNLLLMKLNTREVWSWLFYWNKLFTIPVQISKCFTSVFLLKWQKVQTIGLVERGQMEIAEGMEMRPW